MKLGALAFLGVPVGCGLGLAVACGGSTEIILASPPDASVGGDAGVEAPPSACGDDTNPPPTLDCTGLYTDVAGKVLSPRARAYAPAVPLWSDGAEKARWIDLPDGATIDASQPNEWAFPVGTKAWKEFRVAGHRVETRFFKKVRSDRWIYATYVWSADERSATRSGGADIEVGGAAYHVPTSTECNDCHKGRRDRLLGFEQISLGLAGATGLTLAALANEGRLTPAPARTSLAVQDDGTGVAAPALAWLHVNCGVTCHSPNENATGYGTGLRLRLDATQLANAPSPSWDVFRTTVGVDAITPRWSGEKRIVAGAPDDSLLVRLIAQRGDDQMPPIASRVVDQPEVDRIVEWISKMPHAEPVDAGTADAGNGDADADAASPDAGSADAASSDAASPDAASPDAALPDAGDDGDAPATDAAPDATPLRAR